MHIDRTKWGWLLAIVVICVSAVGSSLGALVAWAVGVSAGAGALVGIALIWGFVALAYVVVALDDWTNRSK